MSISKIFPQNIYKDKIIYLDKKEWQIYYSTKYKYPYLVIEDIKLDSGIKPQKEQIKRTEIEDPFMPDPEIPAKESYTKKDYDNYMMYGGSMGHNAPAGSHKTNMDIYNDTYKFSNMTPQEITFNAGVWVVLESWCRYVSKNMNLKNFTILTGSIPNKKNNLFYNTEMNVPTNMYKIVLCQKRMVHPSRQNNIFYACFLYPNIPILPNNENTKLWKYLIHINDFFNLTGIELKPIIKKYYPKIRMNQMRLFHMNKINPIKFFVKGYLEIQMKKAAMYGKLIYSNTLEELEKNWQDCESQKEEFKDLQFHREYYDMAKKRIEKLSRSVRILKKKKKKKNII